MGRPKGSRNKNLNLNDIEAVEDTIHILIQSSKYGLLRCIIDKEDYTKVNFGRWQVIKRGEVFHVQSSFDHNIYIHRIILPIYPLIDHKSGNGLDNRKINLRPATKKTNAQNRRVTPGTLKGVSMSCSIKNPFFSRIKVDGRQIYLGSFKTELEAARAYNQAAIKYFGEFARLNIIPDVTSSQEIINK